MIKEYLIPLGVDVDPDAAKQIDRITSSLTSMAKTAAVLAGGMMAATTAVSAFVLMISKGTEDVARTAGVLGEATDMLDRWNVAANMATGRTSGISAELMALGRNASLAARGMGQGLKTFGLLTNYGFSGLYDNGRLKGTREILLDVAEALRKVEDPARRIELAESLGLAEILPFLMKGREGILGLLEDVDALGVATEEDAAAARELMYSWRSLVRVMLDASRFIATTVSPYLNQVVRSTVEWYKANREILRQRWLPFLKSVGNAVYVVWRTLFRVAQIVDDLISSTVRWSNVLRVALAAVAALAVLLTAGALASAVTLVKYLIGLLATLGPTVLGAAVPFAVLAGKIALVLAAVLLLFLALEDVWTTMEGGDGLLDEWANKKIPLLSRAIRGLSAGLSLVVSTLQLLRDVGQNPFDMDTWTKGLDKFGERAADAARNIMSAATLGLSDNLAAFRKPEPGTAEEFWGSPLVVTDDLARGAMAGAAGRGPGGVTVNNGGVTINISGADGSNPENFRKIVTDVLRDQTRLTIEAFETRVAK